MRLTAIGVGTAFGLLALLTLILSLVARLVASGQRRALRSLSPSRDESLQEATEKATAAVVAVSFLIGQRGGAGERMSGPVPASRRPSEEKAC